jgi:hypothetical protein
MTDRSVSHPEQAGEALVSCLAVARVEGDPSDALKAVAPWDEMIRQAIAHGVAGILYRGIAGRDDVPPEARRRLRAVTFQTAARNLRLYAQLAEALRALNHARIEAIVLKGAFLAEAIYGNPGLRPMQDIDLLVRAADFEAAIATVRGLGYDELKDPVCETIDYARHHHGHPLVKPGGVRVEIHRTISRSGAPFRVDVDGLWSRAVPAKVAGLSSLALGVEDLLLHLCLHAVFDHGFRFGLRGVFDVAEVVSRHEDRIAWGTLAERGAAWGVQKCAYLMLRLARELFGARVPDGALQKLEPARLDPRLVSWARSEVLFIGERNASAADKLALLRQRQGWREKAEHLLRTAFPPRTEMARMYPGPRGRSWADYPMRWKDLLKRYGRSAATQVRVADVDRAMERQSARTTLRAWLTS